MKYKQSSFLHSGNQKPHIHNHCFVERTTRSPISAGDGEGSCRLPNMTSYYYTVETALLPIATNQITLTGCYGNTAFLGFHRRLMFLYICKLIMDDTLPQFSTSKLQFCFIRAPMVNYKGHPPQQLSLSFPIPPSK